MQVATGFFEEGANRLLKRCNRDRTGHDLLFRERRVLRCALPDIKGIWGLTPVHTQPDGHESIY